jgi:hypothetical protein
MEKLLEAVYSTWSVPRANIRKKTTAILINRCDPVLRNIPETSYEALYPKL